jgi:hypothetical protein
MSWSALLLWLFFSRLLFWKKRRNQHRSRNQQQRATTFVHLHIQKTAGSALQCFMEEHPLSPCTIERAAWASDIESRQPQGAYVSGFWNTTAAVAHTANAVKHNFPNAWCKGGEIGGTHASLSTLRLAAEAAGKHKVRFVTMLREPVARVISEWINNADDALKDRNCAALTGNAWRPYVGDWEYRCGGWRVDANCSFASFLNSSAAEVGWSNRQTRMLVAPGVRHEGDQRERDRHTAHASPTAPHQS